MSTINSNQAGNNLLQLLMKTLYTCAARVESLNRDREQGQLTSFWIKYSTHLSCRCGLFT